MQEVGEGLLVVGFLTDEGVGVEPEEFALLVVVLAALPVGPGGVAAAEDAGGDGGVFGRTPLAAGLVVKLAERASMSRYCSCDLRPERAARTFPRYWVMPS